MISIKPLTKNQQKTFDSYFKDQNLFLHGMAGTGKSFLALHLALEEVLSGLSVRNKIIIVRSAVPSRDIGFLPGSVKEKTKEYETPYNSICTELFNRGDAYQILKSKNIVDFISTSYLRGLTFDEAIMVIDEIQNFTFQEASSILTRVGKNCRVIIAGDFRQTDLTSNRDLFKLMKIVQLMKSFSFIEFGLNDIVRSKFIREFISAALYLEDKTQDLWNKNTSHIPSLNGHLSAA